jgi:hypothetical protein
LRVLDGVCVWRVVVSASGGEILRVSGGLLYQHLGEKSCVCLEGCCISIWGRNPACNMREFTKKYLSTGPETTSITGLKKYSHLLGRNLLQLLWYNLLQLLWYNLLQLLWYNLLQLLGKIILQLLGQKDIGAPASSQTLFVWTREMDSCVSW